MIDLIQGDCLEKMCDLDDRDFIGIELDEHYFEIAEKRINSPIQKELL